MTEPSQYFKGRTVQEQMNEVIGYVDTKAAEVATAAIASDVAQVHQDMLDADADASAAAASAAAAAGTLANAVKKTGEASQSIAGDIAVSGTLSGGVVTGTQVTVPTPSNNTDAANKKYVDDADALDVHLAGNQTVNGVKTFGSSPVVPTVATGTFDTKAVNGTKLQNEILNNTNIVRTANNQNVGGVKTFTGTVALNNACVDNLAFDSSNPTGYYHQVDIGKSSDNVNLAERIIAYDATPSIFTEQFFVHHPNNGAAKLIIEVSETGASLYFRRYKPDGTIKSTTTIATISDA